MTRPGRLAGEALGNTMIVVIGESNVLDKKANPMQWNMGTACF
jgi:hypothetical protein